MVKITFELTEEFINENAEFAAPKEGTDAKDVLRRLSFAMCFNALKRHVDAGKKDFVITTDKLDENSMLMYDRTIDNVAALAAFSVDDKEESDKKG